MTKFTDSLRAALARKQAAQHPDAKSAETNTPGAAKPTKLVANKPQKKVTGRGR
jgi:hypothetical protein